MKKVRKGQFETNSSSTHAISISKGDGDVIYDSLEIPEDGTYVVTGGEFGWEWKLYSDPETKISYAYEDNRDSYDRLDMLKRVIMEHTGAKDVVFMEETGGYIDHQSMGTSQDAFESDETLKRFLFDPRSILYTGNDNSNPPSGFPNYSDEDYED